MLVENLLALAEAHAPTAAYHGYTSCPVVTGYDSLVLAEFNCDKTPQETLPFD